MDHPVAVPQVWWWVCSGDMEGDLVIKVCPRGGVNSLTTRSNPHYYPTCPDLGVVGHYIDTRIRWRMVWQREVQGLTLERLTWNLSVDVSTVYRIVKKFEETGTVSKKSIPSQTVISSRTSLKLFN